MPATDKTSTAGTDKPADKPDTGEATTSATATDASATAGAFGSGDKPADVNPQRVVIEQPAPEPAVYYGEDAQKPAPRDHVRADYKPFEW